MVLASDACTMVVVISMRGFSRIDSQAPATLLAKENTSPIQGWAMNTGSSEKPSRVKGRVSQVAAQKLR